MTERDIPESWSPAQARELDKMTRLSRERDLYETPASDVPASGSKSVKYPMRTNSEQSTFQPQSKKTFPSGDRSGHLPRWTKSWVLWIALLALVPGAIAFMATAMLLKLPSAPNCPSIFWPLASAAVRLHCAQLAASKQTVKDLLQAITLVKQLPDSHPLRGEIDRLIEGWSKDILQLADQSFQAGKLDEAIATVRQIPDDLPAYKLVEDQIIKWESIWSEAENIYREAEAQLRQERWNQAFMLAAKLLRTDSQYWSTVKYDQLNRLIVSAREDGDTLSKARHTAKRGGVENILKAINLAESIQPDSYVYQKAQEAIPKFGQQILKLAQAKLDQQDADEAIAIAQKIPVSAKMEQEVNDFIVLADAQRNAWVGTISSLELAIEQAQQIEPTRPVYEKAQELIVRWQLEIEDVTKLERARSIASQGTISDLAAAIAEAQLVPPSNPRAKEAQQEINTWVAQIQTIEDQPYLDRAEQLAVLEDVNSLQAAIAEASQIGRGRALYTSAQKRVSQWTQKIQRIEDQPYLDQARELARIGNLPAAIEMARQIAPGRALSGEAQASIDEWQGQIRARENWRRAREVASTGTPEALAEAIQLANRIPRRSVLRSDANFAIDQWSEQILAMARSQALSDILAGIEIAKLVPPGTLSYEAAQEQIRTWDEFLNPPPPVQFERSTVNTY